MDITGRQARSGTEADANRIHVALIGLLLMALADRFLLRSPHCTAEACCITVVYIAVAGNRIAFRLHTPLMQDVHARPYTNFHSVESGLRFTFKKSVINVFI